jgi:catechol 2,3-dioxygenase-like lactoylglutathione lyase family enzyme
VIIDPALGAPVQIAYAVPDVHAAAERWAATVGAGPFFVAEHIPLVEVRYRGAPGQFDHSSAYGQWGRVMVELVEDHTPGPSPVKDVVGESLSGLHHLAFFVDDIGATAARLVALGWPEALHAVTSTGSAFAFHDATATLGHMIELYEPTPRLLGFYAMVADAADGWDGQEPVRSASRR